MSKLSSKVNKLGRPRAQRQALLRSLADSLIMNESIETTLPKAKAVVSYTEKLITRAKQSQKNVHQRRIVINGLATVEAAHKLVDEIAPTLESRTSGYFRVEKLGFRRGDMALLAKVSFVDDRKSGKKMPIVDKDSKKSLAGKDRAAKNEDAATSQPVLKDTDTKIQPKTTTQAPKRSGVRGNR